MNIVILEGKKEEDLIKKAQEKLNANINEIVYNITEKKSGILKNKIYEIKACTYQHITAEIINFLNNIITGLDLQAEITSKIEDNKIKINIDSTNNSILIGKNGERLKSLEILCRQFIKVKYNYNIILYIDIEDYKEIQKRKLENLAKKVAKEVKSTNIEASLDNMNSYERRIVHNALAKYEGITTSSEGEEPNRHVVIKPIKNK